MADLGPLLFYIIHMLESAYQLQEKGYIEVLVEMSLNLLTFSYIESSFHVRNYLEAMVASKYTTKQAI